MAPKGINPVFLDLGQVISDTTSVKLWIALPTIPLNSVVENAAAQISPQYCGNRIAVQRDLGKIPTGNP
jgi:hypothetical protein